MNRKEYLELLRDPRWQKKRLEIMSRDGFECCDCGAKHKTLNVHHIYYANGRSPWDYEAVSLRTLCEDCHTSDHANSYEWEREYLIALKSTGLRPTDMAGIAFWISEMKKVLSEEDTKKVILNLGDLVFLCSQTADAHKKLAQFVEELQCTTTNTI